MNADEELQNRIDDNELEGIDKTDAEIIAYTSIFEAVSKFVEYSASADLANAVIKKIERKQKRSFFKHDFFWLCAGISVLLTVGVYTVIKTEVKVDFGFLDSVAYKGVLAFGICFIAGLNYIDRRLLRKRKGLIA